MWNWPEITATFSVLGGVCGITLKPAGKMNGRGDVPRFTTNRLGALAILLIMGLAWGLSFSLGKVAATGGTHPFAMSFWPCWTAAVLLIGITFTRRQSISLTLSLIGFFMIIGLLGLVIPTALFYFAASHVPAGVLSLTVALVPILTFVASAIYGLEKFSYSRLLFLTAERELLPSRPRIG
jgi:drug/metabolite transporter (DMT)-like permease